MSRSAELVVPRARVSPARIVVGLIAALLLGSVVFYGLLAIDAGRALSTTLHDDQATRQATQVQALADAGVEVETLPEAQRSAAWVNLMARATSARYAYGHDSIWDTAIYYSRMPATHKRVLIAHTVLAGFGLLIGGFQFWPALRRRRPRLHRALGKAYAGSVQLAMLFAVAYLLLTGVANTYSTLIFHVGLWVLAISVSGSLWMALIHVGRREFAQHQAWMAMNFGLLLTAPLLRYDWTLLGVAFPALSQNEVNLSVMVFLIPQSFLCGYAVLCCSRALQPARATPQTLAIVERARSGYRYLHIAAPLVALVAAGLTVQHYLLSPGLSAWPTATALVPPEVVALETQWMASALASRLLYGLAALLVYASMPLFLRAAFRVQASQAHDASLRGTAGLISVGALLAGAVQLSWGYALGAPSHARLAGGTFYVLDGLIALAFGAALGVAVLRRHVALQREWGVFAVLAVLATPLFYLSLPVLQWIGIPAVYVAGGHAYLLAASSGGVALLLGFAYAAYGSATREKLAY